LTVPAEHNVSLPKLVAVFGYVLFAVPQVPTICLRATQEAFTPLLSGLQSHDHGPEPEIVVLP
jgi:hypothetical protein